ncbi:MAG: elongation factor P maturation arginine rhamnosyltransferase EarP [Lautropia sp.]
MSDLVRPGRPLRWDLFCRVVDNLGDAAIMWRLSRQLALEHGCSVFLFIDQLKVLQRLLPRAAAGVTIDGVTLRGMPDDAAGDETAQGGPADVVVSGLHADLPTGYRRRMLRRPPAWINLEYLSAETWIDGFHGLPSPQPDGLTQYFFYPGFTPGSGGLLRESDLFDRRDAFGADPEIARRFLAGLGVERRPDELLASLLCYPEAPLQSTASAMAGAGTRLQVVLPHGAAGPAVDKAALKAAGGGQIRFTPVPFLSQYDYDFLLWSCDVNFVRGEDSWIRALWAGKPFIWQVYKQSDAVHLKKLDAFLRLLGPADNDAATALAQACRWWNQAPGADAQGALAGLLSRRTEASHLVAGVARRVCDIDLASRLLTFADAIRCNSAGPSVPPGTGRVQL